MRIILASGSPRRLEILNQVGADFEVIKSSVEEIYTSVEPSDIVMELSGLKALDIAAAIDGDAVIIGADTIVAYGKKILGKPADKDEAYDMLNMLNGKIHEVYTGVTLVIKKRGELHSRSFFERTKVSVCPMSKEEIVSYIESEEPLDKAGAYGIQGRFAVFIKEIIGDYYNVVGFPISRVYQELAKEGICLLKGK